MASLIRTCLKKEHLMKKNAIDQPGHVCCYRCWWSLWSSSVIKGRGRKVLGPLNRCIYTVFMFENTYRRCFFSSQMCHWWFKFHIALRKLIHLCKTFNKQQQLRSGTQINACGMSLSLFSVYYQITLFPLVETQANWTLSLYLLFFKPIYSQKTMFLIIVN